MRSIIHGWCWLRAWASRASLPSQRPQSPVVYVMRQGLKAWSSMPSMRAGTAGDSGVHANSKTNAARPVKGTAAAIAKSAGVGADS
jgi:hypothetical protein